MDGSGFATLQYNEKITSTQHPYTYRYRYSNTMFRISIDIIRIRI
jgi:hypothetical protein